MNPRAAFRASGRGTQDKKNGIIFRYAALTKSPYQSEEYGL